jgi:hypothetical protein
MNSPNKQGDVTTAQCRQRITINVPNMFDDEESPA